MRLMNMYLVDGEIFQLPITPVPRSSTGQLTIEPFIKYLVIVWQHLGSTRGLRYYHGEARIGILRP